MRFYGSMELKSISFNQTFIYTALLHKRMMLHVAVSLVFSLSSTIRGRQFSLRPKPGWMLLLTVNVLFFRCNLLKATCFTVLLIIEILYQSIFFNKEWESIKVSLQL